MRSVKDIPAHFIGNQSRFVRGKVVKVHDTHPDLLCIKHIPTYKYYLHPFLTHNIETNNDKGKRDIYTCMYICIYSKKQLIGYALNYKNYTSVF